MAGFVVFTAVMVLALLVAEVRGSSLGRSLAKPLASFGFIGAAWATGATATGYGCWVMLALVLSWLGDVFLIANDSPRVFRAGLVAFLLGHVAFAAAFILRGQSLSHAALALLVLAGLLLAVLRWLGPRLQTDMRIPVYVYTAVITAMVVLAVGTHGYESAVQIPVGALMFYFSDLAVARDRFVQAGFVNRLWGLPLYYSAQLVLASTV